MLKSGRLVAFIAVHFTLPHEFTPNDVTLVEETADRTWAAVERTRAEKARWESEERQTFLLRFSDILQRFTQANDIKAAAMRVLGKHLDVSRAQYHVCDRSGEYYDADGIGYANGLPLLRLRYRIDDFGTFVAEDFAAGRPFRSDDLFIDPRLTAEERDAYRFYGIRSGAGVPLLRGGKLVAILALHDVRPRHWTDAEFELIRETAERIWTAVERARAEAALRESEGRYHALAANLPNGAAFVVDHDLRYLLAEGEALQTTGFASDEFLGRTIHEVLGPELAKEHEANYRTALEGRSIRMEHTAHGRRFVSHIGPLYDAEERIYAALAVSYDVTVTPQDAS